MITKNRLLLFLLLALLCPQLSVAAQSAKQDTEKLKDIKKSLQRVQQKIQKNRARYHPLQKELKNTETTIGQLAKTIEQQTRQLRKSQRQIKQLKKQQVQAQKDLQTQKDTLSQQIRAAYMMGQQDYLKLLLNQQDPARLGRIMTYYQYFNNARLRQMQKISQLLETVQVLEQNIILENQAQQKLLKKQQRRKQQLEKKNQQRQQVLTALGKTYKKQKTRLGTLQQDKKNLQEILKQVSVQPHFTPLPDTKAFAELKRQLPWPVQGNIAHHYGSERGIGSLKWQGLFITAPTGRKVRAVANGRVVYADWFRHFGQLIIIEHDQAYMTLYGHNQSLYVKTGVQVKAGKIIASVGNSGGNTQNGLYFELRKRGNPINPHPWFRP